MNVCLDTNAYNALLKGDERILPYIRRAETVAVPAIVLGELYFGFHNGSMYQQNVQVLQRFLQQKQTTIVPVSPAIAQRYGKLRTVQLQQGKVVADNDLWIAATSLYLEMPLLSFDSDFDRIIDQSFRRLPD